MRWKIKSIPKEPEVGDARYIRKFAWKPTVVGNFKVWLESYQVTEEYQKMGHMSDYGMIPYCRWLEVKRETLDYYI